MRSEISSLREGLNALNEESTVLRNQFEYMRNQNLASALSGGEFESDGSAVAAIDYWTKHNVTHHHSFESVDDSVAFLKYRNDQYPGYEALMPNSGHDNKVILDYGCGPGHDLVGFGLQSTPQKLIGADISKSSLAEAEKRLSLHGIKGELHELDGTGALPLESDSIDYLHCSGVLMLVPDPLKVLQEFVRVLKPGGEIRLMIYNRDSLWFHLYVAYVVMVEFGFYPGLTVEEAFGRTTDGEECPLVRVWSPGEMIELAKEAGLRCEFIGAAPALWEMAIAANRFRALMSSSLGDEHHEFLSKIRVNNEGIPFVAEHVAGIDGCFSARV